MTKNELIELCRSENPTMTATINGEDFILNPDEYEQALNDWAEMRLIQIEHENKQAKLSTPIVAD